MDFKELTHNLKHKFEHLLNKEETHEGETCQDHYLHHEDHEHEHHHEHGDRQGHNHDDSKAVIFYIAGLVLYIIGMVLQYMGERDCEYSIHSNCHPFRLPCNDGRC